jgi:hypothetical protein
MKLRWLTLSSAPQDGGQINQVTLRLDVRFLISALPQVFDAQIIQPRGIFYDGFSAFGSWLNGAWPLPL